MNDHVAYIFCFFLACFAILLLLYFLTKKKSAGETISERGAASCQCNEVQRCEACSAAAPFFQMMDF